MSAVFTRTFNVPAGIDLTNHTAETLSTMLLEQGMAQPGISENHVAILNELLRLIGIGGYVDGTDYTVLNKGARTLISQRQFTTNEQADAWKAFNENLGPTAFTSALTVASTTVQHDTALPATGAVTNP
jgi:hypothetical protein